MNAEQHARARIIIENAPFLCDGVLSSDIPRHGEVLPERGFMCCGLGELLVAAGYRYEDLRDDPNEWTLEYPRVVDVYGLDEQGCVAIVQANEEPLGTLGIGEAAAFMVDYSTDLGARYDLPRARKAAVLQVLDTIYAASLQEVLV